MPPKNAPRGPTNWGPSLSGSSFSGGSLLTNAGSGGRGSPGDRNPAKDRDDDEAAWRREAFRQGVHHRNWDKGVRLNDALNFAAELGVPHSDDVYRGRDGWHYQINDASREDQEMLALRRHYLKQEPDTGVSAWETIGRAMDKALPQAMQIMAREDRSPPAPQVPVSPQPAPRDDFRAPVNQSRPPVPPTQTRPTPQRDDFRAPPANENAAPLRIGKGLANDNAPVPPPGPIAVGRGPMKGAAKPSGRDVSVGERLQEMAQDADDAVRLAAGGVTIGGADHVAAAGNALGALLTDEDYIEAYRKNLAEELAKTEDARRRMGMAGVVAEASPTALPIIGDAVGLLGDIKYFKEHPEELTLGNAALSALGLIPGIPALAGTVKRVDDALSPARLPFDKTDPKAVDNYLGRSLNELEGNVGHVNERHVVPTDEELVTRAISEPHIGAASKFANLETAERVIHDTLSANKPKILAWLEDGKVEEKFVLFYTGPEKIGISASKDKTIRDCTDAVIVMKKNSEGGFDILTAYPTSFKK
jgi:Bacterial CdiA-CT RNAse A domain